MAKRHPIPGTTVRDGRMVVYMTPEDLEHLTVFSESIGLNRSGFVAAILERLIIGGFSPVVGAKLCWQIQNRCEEKGIPSQGFYFGIRPLPPLPDEDLSNRDQTKLLAQIKTELKVC